MVGSSARRGAVRKSGTKKGQVVGSGGNRRQGLEGKGPTPKATERTGHPAARKATAARRAAAESRSGGRSGGRRRTSSDGSTWVAGRNPVLEALLEGVPVKAIYVARTESDARMKQIIQHATDTNISLLAATRTDLDRLTDGAVHQGVAAQIPAYAYADPRDLIVDAVESATANLLVAADGITDPRNLGAIVRSVAAFGGRGVVVPSRRSAGVSAATWKASAGAVARIPVAQATNLVRFLTQAQTAGYVVVGLDAGGAQDVAELAQPGGLVDPQTPVVLVVGAEGSGLSRLVRQTCDVVASIPIAGSTESLNASVAAGIALYELRR